MLDTDIAHYLPDCLLTKVDVATMAHGLEARAPLLDQELLRFAMSLPDAWLADGHTGKKILRTVLRRYLPSELFERPKQGFDTPIDSWFRDSMRAPIEALASSDRLLATGWFAPRGIRLMIREHQDGLRDHSQRLFNLLVLDEWLKRH